MIAPRPKGLRGFTLIELLVVVLIIGIISAVALPVVLPALNERRVSEAARQLQAILAGARDSAIRANAPRGIRLLPDPVFNYATTSGANSVLASNRLIPIETAPDYSEGLVTISTVSLPYLDLSNGGNPVYIQMLQILEVTYLDTAQTLYSDPTSWYWNIRAGEKLRFSDSGQYYTIAGPMKVGPYATKNSPLINTERFLNLGAPTNTFPSVAQYIFVTNGVDDNGNGYIDEAFDGIDNDGDGIIDPMFNGLDDDGDGTVDNETSPGEGGNPLLCDTEVFDGSQNVAIPTTFNPLNYVISRRPVVSPGAREVTLPAGVVIDLTTWNAAFVTPTGGLNGQVLQPERSRLPVDPYSYFVDIMIAPSGQVLQKGAGASNGMSANGVFGQSLGLPFYHFWLTEREGVQPPLWGTVSDKVSAGDTALRIPLSNPTYGSAPPVGTPSAPNYLLPMPKGTPAYLPMSNQTSAAPAGAPYSTSPVFLTGQRRLVTLFLKTGQVVTNSIETFNAYDTNQPFYDAQAGVKESQ